jgi:hypothetical protein
VTATLPEPRASAADLAAEVARLREQVIEMGEVCADVARRLGAQERFRELAETRAAPLPPYEQAVAWQARRRGMHAVRAVG